MVHNIFGDHVHFYVFYFVLCFTQILGVAMPQIANEHQNMYEPCTMYLHVRAIVQISRNEELCRFLIFIEKCISASSVPKANKGLFIFFLYQNLIRCFSFYM